GLQLGLLRHGPQWRNVLLATFGGGSGAAAGASGLILFGETIEYVTRAAGLMLTGASICVCAELAVRVRRKAVLRFARSAVPDVNAALQGQDWELLRHSRVLLGSVGPPSAGAVFVQVPDQNVARLHAWIRGRKEGFELSAHQDNDDLNGGAIWTLEAGSPPTALRGPFVLRDGDEIVIGTSRFTFETRRRSARSKAVPVRLAAASRTSLVLVILFFAVVASASATVQQLRLAERPRLLRAAKNSEAPAFSVQFNLVDGAGNALPVPVLSPARARAAIRVSETGLDLDICHVSLGTLPVRRAILLLDISGSRLEPMSDGRRKVDVMKEAALRFVASFEEGVDRVAVIPFHSRGVASGVREARFLLTAPELRDAIQSLPVPSTGNTGLYTAVLEAIARFRSQPAAEGDEVVQN
ncbi:MAG: hypothetical protein ACREMA_16335, partial [Longimicrobiales bacterium]